MLPHTGTYRASGVGGNVPEPGEVKHGLVWTGSQWVPLRPSAAEESPEPEGHKEGTDVGGSLGVEPARSDSSANRCPVCRKDDRLVRVSGLLDSASSQTTGSGTTVGIGAGSGGLGAGVAVSEYQAETVTRLVQRFAPPSAPKGVGCGITALSVLAILVVVGVLGALGAPDVVGWIVLVAGIGAGIFAYVRLSPARGAQKVVWQECLDEVRSAYYCSRDDVAFEAGDLEASTPEALVLTLFEPYFEVSRKGSE